MMKTIKAYRFFLARLALLGGLALLCLVQAPHARADMMLLTDTEMVKGAGSAVFSFDAPTAGTVTAQLSTAAWGPVDPLSALSFMATTTNSVLSSWSVTDSHAESFQVGPGTYFAHIMATAGGALDVGTYSLNLTFTPTVPLPATAWMLIIGLLVLFGLARVQSARGSIGGFLARPTP
jgi:hypothetical protein